MKSKTHLGNLVIDTFLLLPLTKNSTEEVVKTQTQPTELRLNFILTVTSTYHHLKEISLLY